jgi:hypothetical protein
MQEIIDCEPPRNGAENTAQVAHHVHDQEWWAIEARRLGTDWDGIIKAHLSVLAGLGVIELAPSSFELACEESDRKATISAVVSAARRHGLKALKQPKIARRLAGCDAITRDEITKTLLEVIRGK